MTPLQEYPHLFANGKFRVLDEFGDIKHLSVNTLLKIGDEYMFQKHRDGRPTINISLHKYTLIARPIEDMTDDEISSCPTFKPNDITAIEEMKYRLFLWTFLTGDLMPAVVQNYLLSIGVYPFDQSHFEDGTVIKAQTNENT